VSSRAAKSCANTPSLPAASKATVAALEALKKSLLHQAFTGQL
jgi:hypothetical protein